MTIFVTLRKWSYIQFYGNKVRQNMLIGYNLGVNNIFISYKRQFWHILLFYQAMPLHSFITENSIFAFRRIKEWYVQSTTHNNSVRDSVSASQDDLAGGWEDGQQGVSCAYGLHPPMVQCGWEGYHLPVLLRGKSGGLHR